MLLPIAFLLNTLTCDALISSNAIPIEKPHRSKSGHKGKHSNSAPHPHSYIAQQSCATLTNVRGTHYTVPIAVGTPMQRFDIVADTGSSNLIVESCECRNAGVCDPDNRCFANRKSPTMHIKYGQTGPEQIVLMFGSGPIESVIASDVVTLGSLQCTLDEGVFLMVDKLLTFSGPFEGILGLGLPESVRSKAKLLEKMSTYNASRNGNGSRHFPSIDFPPADLPLNSTQTIVRNIPFNESQTGANFFKQVTRADYIWTPKIYNNSDMEKTRFASQSSPRPNKGKIDDAFLQKAGVERFSICLSDDGWLGDSGVLRMNTPLMHDAFTNTGDMHWALDFRGISVGTAEKPDDFCSPEQMPIGQDSPCGAVVDSGTTYILGPKDDIQKLYGHICDQWPRCINNYTAMQSTSIIANTAIQKALLGNPWSNPMLPLMEKAHIFQALLRDCNSWFDDERGFNELPTLHFHIADSDKNKSLDLDPWSYIISQNQNEMKYFHEDVPGMGAVITDYNTTGRKTWSCTPTFGAIDYPTPKNGPGWILGIPFFYEYVVHYDLSSEPPSIAFSKEKCGNCEPSLNRTSQVEQLKRNTKQVRLPRRMHGDPRSPSINFETLF